MIKWLENVWKDFSSFFQRKDKPFKVSHREELPDKPKRGTLYAIGEGTPWALAFLCPCRCGALIQLSLLREDRPSWKMHLDRKNRPTLTPSVWRTAGCRSHFILLEGRIIWCKRSAH
jgi:hypothetical protein